MSVGMSAHRKSIITERNVIEFVIGEFHQVMSHLCDFVLKSYINYLTVNMEQFVIFLLVSASILNRGKKVSKI